MDRRTFVRVGLSSLLAYNCSYARALATTTIQGCRMAAAGGTLGVTLREPPSDLHRLLVEEKELIKRFGVQPTVSYYDDDVEQPNALATPTVIFPDGPDGTVLLGINLFTQEIERVKSNLPASFSWTYAIRVIKAHELGHIMQYRAGLSPDGPWQMEPHADFLAGWALAGDPAPTHADSKTRYGSPDLSSYEPLRALKDRQVYVEAAVKALFERGDYLFNDHSHHGEPDFRAAMVRAGYESGKLDVKEAFDRGKMFAGLN